jgi:hypothetical protein
LTSPRPTKELERLVRREFRKTYVGCVGHPLSDVDCVRGRGEPELYDYNSPDAEDDKACRISLDLANVEQSRNGIEKFITKWGPPTGGLVSERQFWDLRQQVRFILLSAMVWRHDDLEDRIFRTYRGTSPQPRTPFECAIRELQALAEHGTLMQILKCQECKHFYIANKRTASRSGRRKQKFCRTCGGRARPKAHRLRLKMKGAAGPTGKRVTADPTYAKLSTRYMRQR